MAAREKTLQGLDEGSILKGVVKNITEYGAFIDLGGIDGLLHITDMSWGRVTHPSELFQVAQEIQVIVLKFDRESKKVSLGYKQRMADPWLTAGRALCGGREGHGTGHHPHGLRGLRRARAGHRRAHPRLRDELDQAAQAPLQGARRRSGGRVPGAGGGPGRAAHLARPQADRARSRGRSSPNATWSAGACTGAFAT